MAILDALEPKAVFSFFEQLCAIPHGSGNTRPISDWLTAFARDRGLDWVQDAVNNVVIWKDASPGYERAEPVILQGHMDMVCEQIPDGTKDMTREGLDLAVDGDTVYARGTTLGGDDGIAVAMMLAVLDDDAMPHPRIEVVFTVDEEVGMGGAAALDGTLLQGRRMLNIDSEVEGVFTVGCAGGCLAKCTLPVRREAWAGTELTITIDGLTGGHSGIEIDRGRANANVLLGRLLAALGKETPFRLISMEGGLKDNAIPVKSRVVLSVSDAPAAEQVCAHMEAIFQREYGVTDPHIRLTVSRSGAGIPMDEESTRRAVCMLVCLPNGVQAMSTDIPGLVQTSLNLGILSTEEGQVQASFCVRSSVASQKQMLLDRLTCLMEQEGGRVEVSGDYPAWEYRRQSPLREQMVDVFTRQYGHPPKIESIHAGVECGLFAGKLPGLDCVSFGPDLTEIHTVRERMHISSVQRTWTLLTQVLREMNT